MVTVYKSNEFLNSDIDDKQIDQPSVNSGVNANYYQFKDTLTERCSSAPGPPILIVHGIHRRSQSGPTSTEAAAETSAEMLTLCLL